MHNSNHPWPVIGYWLEGDTAPYFRARAILDGLRHTRVQTFVLRDRDSGEVGLGVNGRFIPVETNDAGLNAKRYAVLAVLPPQYPEWLGDRSFQETYNVKFSYIAGEMANGIATEEMVIQMAKHRMLGFFGAAGLPAHRVEQAIDTISAAVPDRSWGVNLIHSPNEPHMESKLVDLYIRRQVRCVSASAFMSITPAIVAYAAKGLTQDANGTIHRKHHLFAKISQPELARKFMSPPPEKLLLQLVGEGRITVEEARLAAYVPVAEDITVEADSGGHTDNRPLSPLFSSVLNMRELCMRSYAYSRPIRIGIAGGIGTPSAAAAAFAQGASYIMVGSVNQSAVESGLSELGKAMLAKTTLTDTTMAPSADMFEQGVKVQVVKQGTMFSTRAAQLYDIYRDYETIEHIPEPVRKKLESTIFKRTLESVWEDTVQFFTQREPSQIDKAQRNPKHKMALIFRWYIGQASRWAIKGEKEREYDFQIWCGPAMGAFNAWVKGSFLEPLANRSVSQIAYNLLEGATVIGRAGQLRSYGVPVPAEAFDFKPIHMQMAD
ncbi:MAG: Enoyl-[acyl-carrier-protein] reductase [Paenibacillus sp.]|jgi:PfaD family protein|nr:Enoyl-[acyl-carrier-protein] reductase [Paenibacillus sp.]